MRVIIDKEDRNKISYIQKYLNIDLDKIHEKSNLIDDLIFYKKEINIQSCSKNDSIFGSSGSALGADKELVKKSIYDIMNCSRTNNFEYPENKNFAVCLTHDIDDIYPSLQHKLLSSLYYTKNLDLNGIKNLLFWKYKGKEFSPYWNFKEIMKLEEKYDAESSFYFIATDRDIRRFRYSIEDLENELGLIADMGWEIGLHGGYYACCDLEEIRKEKKRLEKVLHKKVAGYRNHYLRFKVPYTWELLAKAGFKYDTTFGYNDMVGFRNGMCHPFKPYDLENDKEFDIYEMPLNIMDAAIFNRAMPSEETWNTTKELIDTVKRHNGVLTVLWHNNTFNCPYRKNWAKFYEKILKYCREKNAWMTSGEEILRRWETGY